MILIVTHSSPNLEAATLPTMKSNQLCSSHTRHNAWTLTCCGSIYVVWAGLKYALSLWPERAEIKIFLALAGSRVHTDVSDHCNTACIYSNKIFMAHIFVVVGIVRTSMAGPGPSQRLTSHFCRRKFTNRS